MTLLVGIILVSSRGQGDSYCDRTDKLRGEVDEKKGSQIAGDKHLEMLVRTFLVS